jgi:tetratricopeptide (TPR) repeat protein
VVVSPLAGCAATFVRRAEQETHPSVVVLWSEGGDGGWPAGTGVLVAPDGVVTAHHVVRAVALAGDGAPPTLFAVTPDGVRRRIVGVRGDSPDLDATCLSVDVVSASPAALRTSIPEIGDSAVVVWRSQGERRVERGRVSTADWAGRAHLEPYLCVDCRVEAGASGSPIFDGEGRVLGIATRGHGERTYGPRAQNLLPLLSAPERSWGVWALAVRDSPKMRAAERLARARIAYGAAGNDAEKALVLYRGVRRDAPDETELKRAVYGECASLFALGRPQEAIRLLNEMLDERPERGWAERLLGWYLLQSRDPKGYEHLAKAAALDPENPTPTFDVAHWRNEVPSGPDPVPALRAAAARQPRCAETWALLGRLAWARGDLEEAVRAWYTLASLRPDHADAFVGLAEALDASGRHDEARESAAAALRIAPRSVPALRALVLARLGLGETEEARRALDALRDVAPEEARALEPRLAPAKAPDGR